MSDVDGSGQIPRRSPRAGDGGAPVSGALAIVLAVVAVVAGFLILRSISDGGENALDLGDGGSSTGAADGSGDESDGDATDGGAAVPTLPTTTTEAPLVTEGAVVIVANANSVGGSASSMTRALESVVGFEVVDPVNASSTVGDLDESRIYYDVTVSAAQAVAGTLAGVLGGDVTVAPLPEVPPTADGSMNGADVLLVLGNDKAGKTLAEMRPDVNEASVVTNPPIAGATETTAG